MPFFRERSLVAAFLSFLILGLVVPPGLPQAVYAGAVFFLILGIKDLVIVKRQEAYETLTFLLAFAGSLSLFRSFAAWSAPTAFAALAFAALMWLWLLLDAPERSGKPALPTVLSALILFELGAAIFFLPLSLFAQGALLFFGSALLFEASAAPEPLAPRHILLWSGAYAVMAFLLVFLAPWKV